MIFLFSMTKMLPAIDDEICLKMTIEKIGELFYNRNRL